MRRIPMHGLGTWKGKGDLMKNYRSPAHQARRWEAQMDAWVCPKGCGHDAADHREHQPTWERGEDGFPVEVKHPQYRPGLFACHMPECSCEFQA